MDWRRGLDRSRVPSMACWRNASACFSCDWRRRSVNAVSVDDCCELTCNKAAAAGEEEEEVVVEEEEVDCESRRVFNEATVACSDFTAFWRSSMRAATEGSTGPTGP